MQYRIQLVVEPGKKGDLTLAPQFKDDSLHELYRRLSAKESLKPGDEVTLIVEDIKRS